MSNNTAHVSSVDKGLKMKITKRKLHGKEAKSESSSTTKGGSDSNSGKSASATNSTSATSAAPTTSSFQFSQSSSLHHLSSSSPLTSSSTSSPSSSSSAHASSVAGLKAGSPMKSSGLTHMNPETKDKNSPKSKPTYAKKVKDGTHKPAGGTQSTNQASSGAPVTGMSTSGQTYTTMTTSNGGQGQVSVTSEPRPGDTIHVKQENPVHDPYEFNDNTAEERIELPPKKLKIEKVSSRYI